MTHIVCSWGNLLNIVSKKTRIIYIFGLLGILIGCCLGMIVVDRIFYHLQRQIRDAEHFMGTSLPEKTEHLKVKKTQFHAGAMSQIRFDMQSNQVTELVQQICQDDELSLIDDENLLVNHYLEDWWQPIAVGRFAGITCGQDKR